MNYQYELTHSKDDMGHGVASDVDGIEHSKNASHIYVVAATSRPDKIDKALLHPGRLEKLVCGISGKSVRME